MPEVQVNQCHEPAGVQGLRGTPAYGAEEVGDSEGLIGGVCFHAGHFFREGAWVIKAIELEMCAILMWRLKR